ncbi:hypothetical protein ACHHYP_17321 [Achlya hypogyna]|uniref:Drug/Metabolite Transporter (DMT) Superfamily n=1 Tax=Achlya hypogyna TaxID=1202772 RepID=A0A1V9Y4N0_ACHHY|nr:hypothetical protein ACHHYP_17321 [Achlya hypogyna]
MLQGGVCAIAAFGLFGAMPFYWYLLREVAAAQVAAHSVVWSALTLVSLVAGTGQWRDFWTMSVTRRNVVVYGIVGALHAFNHLLIIYATASLHVLDVSLGLLLAPFIDGTLACWVLSEPMSTKQWIAVSVAIAAAGAVGAGNREIPIIAIFLPLSVGMSNLLQVLAPVEMFHGITLQTTLLLPPAIIYLVVLHIQDTGAFVQAGVSISAALVGGGVLSTLPPLLITRATVLLPSVSISALQYIAPVVLFVVGAVYFLEPLGWLQCMGFGVVTAMAALFLYETIRETNRVNAMIPVLRTVYLYDSPVQSSLALADRPSLEV